MATRKKAPKRSKNAARHKTAAKPKRAKSATAKSKSKTTKRKTKTRQSASKKKTTAKSKNTGKANTPTKSNKKVANKKVAKRAATTGAKASRKKATRSVSADAKGGKTGSPVSGSSAVARKRRGRSSNSQPRNSEAQKVAVPPPPEEKPLRKTRLNDKQLAEFKNKLLEKRRMLTGDVRNLTLDALRRDGSGDLSNMPIHMADIGSDNWEQEFTLGLIENEQQLVREIDEALARIVNRTYGVCIATGKHIGVARLRAKPWAKYCIEYARRQETGRR